MELVGYFVLFAASLAVLVKASDVFTDAAERLGLSLGLPPFIIGVTIISIGTSLPELISSLFAVLEGAPEVVVSNVVGSNIVNIFLVIGTAALLCKGRLTITYNLVNVDLPLFAGSAFLLGLASLDRRFSQGEAVLFLSGYVIYTVYVTIGSRTAVNNPTVDSPMDSPINETVETTDDPAAAPAPVAATLGPAAQRGSGCRERSVYFSGRSLHHQFAHPNFRYPSGGARHHRGDGGRLRHLTP